MFSCILGLLPGFPLALHIDTRWQRDLGGVLRYLQDDFISCHFKNWQLLLAEKFPVNSFFHFIPAFHSTFFRVSLIPIFLSIFSRCICICVGLGERGFFLKKKWNGECRV